MAKKSDSKIVEAAGMAAGGSGGLTPDVIQEAMAKAAAEAQAEGVTDQEEIKQRMIDARDSLKE
jgi:formaldehyde-activating enzyme involved in methanogenesis